MPKDIVSADVSRKHINYIFSNLESKGFYCLENAISKIIIKKFQKKIENITNTKGKRYLSLINECEYIEAPFRDLYKSENLNILLKELANLGATKDFNKSETLNVIRIVTGEKTDSQSFRFHYDPTIITALIPILIPEGPIERSGHLVIMANIRKIRSLTIINLIEKICIQNIFVQKIISLYIKCNKYKYVKKIKPGNVYLFWGYRSLHASMPVDPKYIRATILFHYGNPHKKSKILKFVAKIRHFRERLNAQAN